MTTFEKPISEIEAGKVHHFSGNIDEILLQIKKENYDIQLILFKNFEDKTSVLIANQLTKKDWTNLLLRLIKHEEEYVDND